MPEYEIIHGDCLQVLPRLTREGIKANLIFADPPYNCGINYGPNFNDKRSNKDYLLWCEQWLGECYINLLDHGSIWVLISNEYSSNIEILIRKTGFEIVNWITWYETFGVNRKNNFTRSSRRLLHAVKDKSNYIFNKEFVTRPSDRQEIYNDNRANPDGRIWDDVWGVHDPIPRVCGTHAERVKGFPTQLPIKLLEPIVSCSSNQGDIILDPFNGSGSTGITCIKLGRKYVGIEVNINYTDQSRERICTFKAKLDNIVIEKATIHSDRKCQECDGLIPFRCNKSVRFCCKHCSARWTARNRKSFNGRHQTTKGYILVFIPEHPNSSNRGYIMEHRVIMEEYIGRLLEPHEVVHHKNGDKGDNRIGNLELMNKNQHDSLPKPRNPIICPCCGYRISKTKYAHKPDNK